MTAPDNAPLRQRSGSAGEAGMNFEPVRTLADLESLDDDEVLAGYLSTERGDPEPGPNRGRAYWHGWRNRMIDMGELPADDASRQLAHEVWPGKGLHRRQIATPSGKGRGATWRLKSETPGEDCS